MDVLLPQHLWLIFKSRWLIFTILSKSWLEPFSSVLKRSPDWQTTQRHTCVSGQVNRNKVSF